MFDTIGAWKDVMFHICIYLFLWRILSELIDIKDILKKRRDDKCTHDDMCSVKSFNSEEEIE